MPTSVSLGPDAAALAWVLESPPAPQWLELDELLLEAAAFWDSLETECVAGCCGLNAFCFWPAIIRQAAAQAPSSFVADLHRLRQQVQSRTETTMVVSRRLNALISRPALLALLDYLLRHLSLPA